MAHILCALPLTSIIALMLPNIGLWASSSYLWWIDITAVVFAVIFIRFYIQAKRRRRQR